MQAISDQPGSVCHNRSHLFSLLPGLALSACTAAFTTTQGMCTEEAETQSLSRWGRFHS